MPAVPLQGKQIRYLKSLAHHLEPVVTVGKEGTSDAVVAATREALLTHELIKVRLPQAEKEERTAMADQLSAALDAHLVGTIGRIALLYRRHPSEPQIKLPRE